MLATTSLQPHCARTTYLFSSGPGGEEHESFMINTAPTVYIGEFSPLTLARQCPHGLQSLTLNHGLYATLLGSFGFASRSGLSGMDLSYRCATGLKRHAEAEESATPRL